VQRLSGKGYPAFIVNPAGSASSQVFKVQVGRYDDRGEAEQVARRLEKEEKFNPWISR
jgi:cell division septation protein DedD